MHINPQNKSITYSLDNICSVEQALDEIQKTALNDSTIGGETARSICRELNDVRDSLSLKRGVQRHEKWAPEMQTRQI